MIRRPRLPWLRLLAVAGVAVLVSLALVSVLAPGLLELAYPDTLVPPPETRSEAAAAVLPVVGVAALVVAAVVALRGRESSDLPALVGRPPETGTTTGFETVGDGFADAVERASDERTWSSGGRGTEREVLDRLRAAAVDAYVIETGVSRAAAERAVETGAWTDDRVAAWTLSESTVDGPLVERLYDRLLPRRALERQVRRTTAAIDGLRGERP